MTRKPTAELLALIRRRTADAAAARQELHRRGWGSEHIQFFTERKD